MSIGDKPDIVNAESLVYVMNIVSLHFSKIGYKNCDYFIIYIKYVNNEKPILSFVPDLSI